MAGAAELREFSRRFRQEVKEETGRLIDKPMPEITEALFALFEQNGNRTQYEAVYFFRRKMLAVLGLEALAQQEETGTVETALIQKLEAVIRDICEERCWALPAHVDRREENWEHTVDLFSAETAQTLSELSDTLGSLLSEETRTLISEQVETRVFTPFFSSEVPYRNWEHCENNWNAVCCGSVGSACLHLLRDQKKRLNQCLDRLCNALLYYIAGFSDDGACLEGLGYFTYGMTYFVKFARELKEYSNGERDLLCGEWGGFVREDAAGDKRAKIASFQEKCFFLDGRTLCFSDGNSRDRFRVGLTCGLAMAYPDVRIPAMSQAAGLCHDSCYRFAALQMDLTLPQKYAEQLEQSEQKSGEKAAMQENPGVSFCAVLPEAQWAVCESENAVGFACKGGSNGESHNHNDIGHFLYETNGTLFLTDLGSGEYTKQYFREGRYEILCCNSFGHSVPILGGNGQEAGDGYRCSGFDAVQDGRMLNVSIGMETAYRAGLAKKLSRTLQFNQENGNLQVSDRFVPGEAFAETEVMTENLVTQILPEVNGNQVTLARDGVHVVLTVQVPENPEITVKEYAHSNHRGEPETVYAVQWKVAGGKSRFSVAAFGKQN